MVKRLVARWLPLLVLAGFLLSVPGRGVAAEDSVEAYKQAAQATLDSHREELIELSLGIWDAAETALAEQRSAALLADYAERQGFRVERGVAGMPTAFVASFGEGKPILGVLGEYDALPGLSQEAVPERRVRRQGGGGHGCGHNLFGPASLGAALAVKELIADGKLQGTVRFYGTPAEEAVGGKLYMARAGLFDDLDVALAWHPETELRADTGSSQALVDFVVEFRGRAAHAALDPWNGRCALDAVELTTHALNMLREHVRPTVRIHYTITGGGDVPNVVPESASLWCWVRDSKRSGVEHVMRRVRKIVEGAALAADVEGELRVQSGDYELLVNFTGARLLQENLDLLGPIVWTEDEQAFARRLQENVGVEALGLSLKIEPLDLDPGEPEGGSSDVGDVSWIVPTLHVSVPTAPIDVPWHAWPVVASSGMSVGHRGMDYAARVLALTLVDLFTKAELREEIRREFEEQRAGHTLELYIPDGPPPLPGG